MKKPITPDRIEQQADSFSTAAILCVVVGVLALLMGFVSSVGVDAKGGGSWWLIMGSAFGLALWLYLIAQIIYIRAQLMRK